MPTEVIHIEDVIQQVAEYLRQAPGEEVEEIVNKLLSNKVKYVGDSFFEVEYK